MLRLCMHSIKLQTKAVVAKFQIILIAPPRLNLAIESMNSLADILFILISIYCMHAQGTIFPCSP